MRTILTICGLTVMTGAFFTWRAMQASTHFGTFSAAPEAPVSDLIEHPKNFLGKTVSVQGVVSEQCKSMGCYFYIRSGKKTLRIDLQEIAMTAPMREGHRARVEGQMVSYSDGYQLFASAVEFK